MNYISEFDPPSALGAALAIGAVHTGTVFETQGSPSPLREIGAVISSDQASAANGAQLQASADNATWRPVAVATLSAGVPVILTSPILARYYRAVVTNGGVAATSLNVQLYRRRN